RRLGDRVAELESELAAVDARLQQRDERVDELETNLKRKQADFQNYKKRSKRKQDQIRERATEEFVSQVVTVRDNLVRALDQDEDADIRSGLESTLKEFDRLLEDENVEVIEPEPGAETDPQRHEVMMRVDSDQPAGTVDEVYQPGYEMADKVIRAAQVTVSEDDGEE
ncbi:nucleotide exchange factor GrpE, partial [Halobium palmae]